MTNFPLENYEVEMKDWLERTNNNLEAIPPAVLRKMTITKRPAEGDAQPDKNSKRRKGSTSPKITSVEGEVAFCEKSQRGDPTVAALGNKEAEKVAKGKRRVGQLVLEIKKEDSGAASEGGAVGAIADAEVGDKGKAELKTVTKSGPGGVHAKVKTNPVEVFLRPPRRPMKTKATLPAPTPNVEDTPSTPSHVDAAAEVACAGLAAVANDIEAAVPDEGMAEVAGQRVACRTRQQTATPNPIASRTRLRGPSSPPVHSPSVLPVAHPKPAAARVISRTKRLSRHSPPKEADPKASQSNAPVICETLSSPRRLLKSIHRLVVSAVTERKGSSM
jgi:hypothetical protein